MIEVIVGAIRLEAQDIHSFELFRADGAALPSFEPGAHIELYLCGPAGFMQWIEESARELGWEASRLHREHFAAAPRDANADGTFEVQLASNGALIRVAAGQTVLAALREAGVDLPASCEQGICGTCLTRVLDGEPEHRDLYLSEEEQAANDCFTPCCSRSRSPRLVLDL